MSEIEDKRTQLANELAIREKSPVIPLSEVLVDIDSMYQSMGKTIEALTQTTVDGESLVEIDKAMQAHTHKKFMPDTELEMMETNAVPMSIDDEKALKERLKRLNSVQYRKSQLKIPTMTLAETTGARVRVAYRLVRYMSHVRGIGAIGTPLIFSMASSNAQVNLFELPIAFDPTVGWYRGLAAVRNLLAQANESPYTYSYFLDNSHYKAKGMSMLPPPLHDGYYPQDKAAWEYRRQQYTPENYVAEADAPLAIYLNMCELLVRHLGIAEEDVNEQAAVAAMLNPKIARLAWPCRDDIETFEEYVFLPYIGRIVVERSQDSAIEILKTELFLTHAEAFDMVETYKTYAQQANVFDPLRERSVMLGKLGKLTEDCSEAGMVTTQHNAIKTTLQVLGLTQHEEESNIDRRAGLASVLEAELVKNKQELPQAEVEQPVQDT